MSYRTGTVRRVLLAACVVLVMGAGAAGAQTETQSYQLFQEARYNEAIIAANAEIRAQPRNPASHIVLGWIYLATARYSQALEIGLRAEELTNGGDARVAGILGEAYYYTNEPLRALPHLEEYVELAPSGVAIGRVHALMGEIFIEFGEYNHAEIAYGAAVHFDPRVSRWWTRLGDVREQLGWSGQATVAYTRAREVGSSGAASAPSGQSEN